MPDTQREIANSFAVVTGPEARSSGVIERAIGRAKFRPRALNLRRVKGRDRATGAGDPEKIHVHESRSRMTMPCH